MKKLLALTLLALSSLFYGKTISCEGTYTAHLQGIDSDGTFIYWSFTNCIVKTDMEGKIILKVDALTHSGDPCLLNGKLYVPVNRGKFNKPKGASKDFIHVYDAETLKLLKTVPAPECDHGAGAMAAYNGHLWLTGGLPDDGPSNIILEYTEELEFVKRHESPGHTKMGIQILKRIEGKWWFGVYDKPGCVICDDEFNVISKPEGPKSSVGMVQLKDGTVLLAKTKGTPIPDNPKRRTWTGTISTAKYDPEKKILVYTD